MPISRKALNYDLDDNLLKKYYPHPKSYKNAWTNVKDFLCDNGFFSIISLKNKAKLKPGWSPRLKRHCWQLCYYLFIFFGI